MKIIRFPTQVLLPSQGAVLLLNAIVFHFLQHPLPYEIFYFIKVSHRLVPTYGDGRHSVLQVSRVAHFEDLSLNSQHSSSLCEDIGSVSQTLTKHL